jgi:hypothetical protein
MNVNTLLLRIAALSLLVALIGAVAFQGVRGRIGQGYYEIVGVGKDAKKVYVPSHELDARRNAIASNVSLTDAEKTTALKKLNQGVHHSIPRTFGIWLAALFTLAIMSFLYSDNPFYRIAEHAYVGVSAAYGMVLTFWEVVIPLLLVKLDPWHVKLWFNPSLNLDVIVEKLSIRSWLEGIVHYEDALDAGLAAPWYRLIDYWYIVPTILGIMLVWRLMPKGGWISRWPIAFIIGATAGMKLIAYLSADFVKQVDNAIKPLIVPVYAETTNAAGQIVTQFDWGGTFYASMNSIILLVGMVCVLIYFFFSLEHKGVVGRLSKLGIWVLMITFGAGFGYTVMGRIALLGARFEFLVKDWLNIVPQ